MLESLMTEHSFGAIANGSPAGATARRRWSFESHDALAAQRIRRAFASDARSHDLETADAELVIGELLGNVVRYAPGPGYVEVRWHLGYVTIHVVDSGAGFTYEPTLPPDPFAQTGRGLFLVRAYARALAVESLPAGGCRVSAHVTTPRRTSTLGGSASHS